MKPDAEIEGIYTGEEKLDKENFKIKDRVDARVELTF